MEGYSLAYVMVQINTECTTTVFYYGKEAAMVCSPQSESASTKIYQPNPKAGSFIGYNGTKMAATVSSSTAKAARGLFGGEEIYPECMQERF